MLRGDVLGLGFRTLMVSRLDGPDYKIIKGLIDKALTAEKTGLKGIAYIDSRQGDTAEKNRCYLLRFSRYVCTGRPCYEPDKNQICPDCVRSCLRSIRNRSLEERIFENG